MYCYSNQQKNNCQCHGGYINNPALWSKNKKINLLEEYLEYLENQINETREAIEGFKK